jgi:hypothetical protein
MTSFMNSSREADVNSDGLITTIVGLLDARVDTL